MKKIIISLGGSLIHPKNLDIPFLKGFRDVLSGHSCKFVIYCGGGALARRRQRWGSRFLLNHHILDWLGIMATRKNAKTVQEILGPKAQKSIVTNPTKKVQFKKKYLVAAGWKPGWSTDFGAVLMAENLGIKSLINMSNIKYVYDKDPKQHGSAKKLTKLRWKRFREIVGHKWRPGLNMPFDPIASRKAQEIGLKVIIIGRSLDNLDNVIKGKRFEGTVIS